MNILNKITINNLKLNKKRAIGTIIGIILSVALICAVATMVSSFHKTLVQNAINETGYYHIELSKITPEKLKELEQNRDIEEIKTVYNLGYSYFEHDGDKDLPYINVLSTDTKNIEGLSYEVLEGRLPENSNEIAINIKAQKDSNYKIGDTITLDIGTRKTNDNYELNENNPYLEENGEVLVDTINRTYKIVGVITKYNTSHGYYGITTNETSNNINTYIVLNDPANYKQAFVEMLGANDYYEVDFYEVKNIDYHYIINHELLRWEVFAFSDKTVSMLMILSAIVVAIIIFTSVFCIRNSFAISTTEKMKMYGMLASVGATKKQIKRSVIYEGFILGIIGIPIGIISGILAVFILLNIVNALLGDFMFNGIDGIIFNISLVPILISAVLGFVTIYFSAISSARRASKVSPIENLRSSKDIKITSKKLRTPKLITKIFKTGGTLAYKNLKRSKKKYRTTVISLTVSIFVFISMYSFITEGFKQSSNYYTEYDYNVSIYGSIAGKTEEEINELKNLDNINKTYILYEGLSSIKITDMNKINFIDEYEIPLSKDNENKEYIGLDIMALDDASFKAYADKLNMNYDEIKDKGILCDMYRYYNSESENLVETRTYTYEKGDVINEYLTNGESFTITIGKVTDVKPYGLEGTYYTGGFLVVNNDYIEVDTRLREMMFESSNPEQLVDDIEKIDYELDVFNADEQVKAQKSMVLVISIFCYGFIAVISLIGVTNIFNTITSNIELRSKEFAMLKSIGMTKKEFNRMVNLETLFYCTKALLYGITLGVLGAFAIHNAFGISLETEFTLPITAIVISAVCVFVLVYVIMRYSISKINKQNVIETIRNDNV